MSLRKPFVAGRFYPSDKEDLLEQIKSCYSHRLGPGQNVVKENVLGGVVPHAGYTFSGPCASHFYSRIKDDFERVIIFSTLHKRCDKPVVDNRDYQTPLGTVKNLSKDTEIDLPTKNTVFDSEHSIEVQLPFLQQIKKDFSFLPVGVPRSSFSELEGLAKKLDHLINEKTLLISSSDMSHIGPNFGDLGISNPGKVAEKRDSPVAKRILEKDPEKMLEAVKKHSSTMCGVYPTLALLYVLKGRDTVSKKLCYYTSQDIMDGENAVGYLSLSFNKK